MATQKARKIDYEMLNLYSGLFEEQPPASRAPRSIDYDVANLRGCVFQELPRVEVPLDSFFPPPPDGDAVETRGPRFDSLAPTAEGPLDVAPAARRRSRAVTAGVMMAASALGVLVGFGAWMQQATPATSGAVAAIAGPLAAIELPAEPAAAPAPAPAAVEVARPAKASPAPAAKIARPAAPAAAPARDAAPPDDLALAPARALPQSIDQAGAAAGIAVAARRAAACLDADDSRTSMAVSITFAPSGRVTRAVINGGPFLGTATGSCIAQNLRTASVGAFDGSAVTVNTTIRVR